MELVPSSHWRRKRQYRSDITDDIIEYAIANCPAMRDRRWHNTLNIICRVPPSGRILNGVYRKLGPHAVKVVTA